MTRARPKAPEFLERTGYRLRRLMDAARVLPIFGLILLMLPLMRDQSRGQGGSTAAEAVYLFSVWLGLVLIAFGMSLGLRRALGSPHADQAPFDPSPKPDPEEQG